MHVTITNLADEPETLQAEGAGIVEVLHSQRPYDLRNDAATVAIIGDKPELRHVIQHTATTVAKVAGDLLRLILGRKQHAADAGTAEEVRMSISNHGANGVRVVLGDGVTEQTVQPGTSATLTAPGYMELRELGLVQQPPGQVEAP